MRSQLRTLFAAALVLAVVATVAPPALASPTSGPPLISGPVDEVVPVGGEASFEVSVDRAWESIEWWGWLPGMGDFERIDSSENQSPTHRVIVTSELDDMVIRAVVTVDGLRYQTDSAHLTVLPSGSDPIWLEDVTTSVGGDAYFTILNADAEPYSSVRWQINPVGEADDAWTDLVEDDSHQGVATPQLVLRDDATAAARSGDQFRAVFVPESQTRAAVAEKTTNIATLTVKGVVISGPRIIEVVPGEDAVLPLTIAWPGYRTEDLKVWWEYRATSGLFRGWTVVHQQWWGVSDTNKPTMRIASTSIKDWNGYELMARVQAFNGDPSHASPSMRIQVIPAPDMSLPADLSVKAGESVTFRGKADEGVYADVRWERKSPAEGSAWETVTTPRPPRSLVADLQVPRVTLADNGYRYRPVFITTNQTEKPGREATLTVVPTGKLDGIYFDPKRSGFRYYVDSVAQDLPTGTHVLDGHIYFVRDGLVKLGYVTDPEVPGGLAHYTYEGGLSTNALIVETDYWRYAAGSGAVLTTAKDIEIGGAQYSFDSQGRGVKVIAEDLISVGSGPGVVRARVIQGVDEYTTSQFAATVDGALGGTSNDVVTVTVGTRSLRFSLNANASEIASALTQHFRQFRGQKKISEIDFTVTLNGTVRLHKEHVLVCPKPSEVQTRGIPTTCTIAVIPPPIPLTQHIDEVYDAATGQLRNLTAAQVEAQLAPYVEPVRADLQEYTANPQVFAGNAPAIAARFIAQARLTTIAETTLTRPTVILVHQQLRGVLQEEGNTAVTLFNAHDAARLARQIAVVRAAVVRTNADLNHTVGAGIRELTVQAIEEVLGAELWDYEEQLDAEFLAQRALLPANADVLAPALAHGVTMMHAEDYEAAEITRTYVELGVVLQILQILEHTPFETNGVPNTFTYEQLDATARTMIGI